MYSVWHVYPRNCKLAEVIQVNAQVFKCEQLQHFERGLSVKALCRVLPKDWHTYKIINVGVGSAGQFCIRVRCRAQLSNIAQH